ncbi:MAG: iron ABC transporter permease [Oscillospiraceae bacterium]|nr:iron ABC transporter permease [Oscillospiraceae bacterium]
MELPKSQLRQEWASAKRRERRTLGIALGVTAAVFLFCMCWRYNAVYYDEKFVPIQYAKSLWLALRLLIANLFHLPFAAQGEALIEATDSVIYYGAIARLKTTAMALVAGAALSVAGAIFQTAYRNPMASPNILGATAGVKLGNVLVVMLYSAQAYDHIFLRYRYCYCFTALCVGLVLLLGRLAGGKREYSITEMVMAGSIISQGLNVLTMYLMYTLTDEDLVLYQEISMGTYLDTGTVSTALFFGVMAVALLPVLLTRYRMNAIGMDPSEAASTGVSVGPLRLVAQLCGVLMVTCAMIHCGEAGMLSMVVPYIVRQVVGADFRRVCIYSVLSGGILMMLCRLLTSFLLIAGEAIPITFFINLALMPVFMVILARQKGGAQ